MTRREWNRELAKRDAMNRCVQCKRALTGRRLVDCLSGKLFDSEECLADYLAGFAESGNA